MRAIATAVWRSSQRALGVDETFVVDGERAADATVEAATEPRGAVGWVEA